MGVEILKNNLGVKVATIKEEHGRYVIYDRQHVRQGSFDPTTNTTKNKYNAIVGTGNLLAALIKI